MDSVKLINDRTIRFSRDEFVSEMPVSELILDPLFWQSLGKALGWKHVCDELNEICKASVDKDVECPYHKQWAYQMHRFIDHLISGRDADSFFKDLLTPNEQR